MATRFVNVDRGTPMLLPPDLREWVPADDMVHFVIEAVEGMRFSALHVNRNGSGSEQYPPKMMMALLIYCYANGIFSSRRIERATHRDVAVRYLTGDTHPDHDTIATFRRKHVEAVGEAFLQVLQLAREIGVLKVGVVSIDGTHIHANASKNRNVRYDRADKLDKKLTADIEDLMAEAERTDRREDDDGQSLPQEIARRKALREKMQQARKELEHRARQRAEAQRADHEKKLADWEQRKGHKGRKPKPPKDTPDDHEQANLTDPDSRLMRKNKRTGYTQSYNAQATVDAEGSQLIVGEHVSMCASDSGELEPAIASVSPEIGSPSAVLADTGYVNADAWDRLESGENGVELYVAVGRGNHTQRTYDYRPTSSTDRPPVAMKDPRLLAMRDKLTTEAGRKLYSKRKHTVEPVFGIIKQVLGFRQFLRRGMAAVCAEWSLVCLAYNVKRLWGLKPA